ncbi:MAG TPA: sensor domain-containing diguanylate cyclase, partial [Candidatus Dormibacteraeota bacterium]|nr:sensor domain-containing diguanylate cyclase [Candidatus Dormibacteraeota bacterium]
MKQRNGAGSKRLVEATERFIRSEQKLLEVLGERRILKKTECAHFAKDLSLSAAKKRSSDVFASAVSINRKLMGMLSKSRSAGERTVTDSDVLGELSRVTQTGGDPIEAFRESLLQIRTAIPFENATLFLLNRQSQTLEEAVSVGGRVDLIGHVNFDRGKGFSSWVAQQRKPVLLNDLHREEGPDAVSLRSFLSVPILVQSEVIGVVNMCHSRPGAFDEESVKRLELMTIPISAIAIRMLLRRERERLATTDDLTTLYNKRHFDAHLEDEVGKAKRYGHKVSVVVLDVDGASERKGRNGNGIGDQILSDMGRLLKRSARGTDCVARYEGDEFRILLPHTDAARAKVAAERLRGVVEQHAFPRRRRLTVHVGVATYPVDGVVQDPASLRASAGVQAGTNGAASVPAVDDLNETVVN